MTGERSARLPGLKWVLLGVAIGVCLGLAFSLVSGHPGLFGTGLGIGISLVISIGMAREKGKQTSGRVGPAMIAGLGVFALGLVILFLIMIG